MREIIEICNAGEADVCLIVAAPVLLEALQMVRQSSEWSSMESATQEAVERAIARARLEDRRA